MNIDLKEKRLRKYYLSGSPVLIIFLITQLFFKFENLSLFYALIGFAWPYAFGAPGFSEKISMDKNKYSFLNSSSKFFTWIFNSFGQKLGNTFILSGLKDILPSICFIFLLSSLVDFQSFYFVLVGNTFYIIFKFLYKIPCNIPD